ALGFFMLWLFLGRWKSSLAANEQDKALNRVSFYKLGVSLLSLFGLTVAIGMSIPFFMALAHRPTKVVEEGLYHMVVVWFFVPIMLLVAIGPFVSWRTLGSGGFKSRIINVLSLAVGLTGVAVL